jgi:hypothetical protein
MFGLFQRPNGSLPFKLQALGLTAEVASLGEKHNRCSSAMDAKAKKSLEAALAEFRKGIAHHRGQGATEKRIRQILGESIWLAFQEVADPELRAWLCEEFSKAARVAPIVTNQPTSPTVH